MGDSLSAPAVGPRPPVREIDDQLRPFGDPPEPFEHVLGVVVILDRSVAIGVDQGFTVQVSHQAEAPVVEPHDFHGGRRILQRGRELVVSTQSNAEVLVPLAKQPGGGPQPAEKTA